MNNLSTYSPTLNCQPSPSNHDAKRGFHNRIMDVSTKVILIVSLDFLNYSAFAQLKNMFAPLPKNAIHLKGYLENDTQNLISHWNKEVVP